MTTTHPIEIRFIVDATVVQAVIDNHTRAGWTVHKRTDYPPAGVHLVLHLDPVAQIPDDAAAAPYKRLVIAMIVPPDHVTWWLILNETNRQKVLDVGFLAFSRAHYEGQAALYAREAAMQAMQEAAQDLGRIDRIVLKRDARAIRKLITKLAAGKPHTVEAGYEVADELKAQGYSWDQVHFAMGWREFMFTMSPEVCGGIHIRYTGR